MSLSLVDIYLGAINTSSVNVFELQNRAWATIFA